MTNTSRTPQDGTAWPTHHLLSQWRSGVPGEPGEGKVSRKYSQSFHPPPGSLPREHLGVWLLKSHRHSALYPVEILADAVITVMIQYHSKPFFSGTVLEVFIDSSYPKLKTNKKNLFMKHVKTGGFT